MAEKKPKKNLKTQLARQSFKLGSRYMHFDADGKRDINTALNYLTQAMLLADENESEARRLLDMSRRITRS
jgi:hypothetical protein